MNAVAHDEVRAQTIIRAHKIADNGKMYRVYQRGQHRVDVVAVIVGTAAFGIFEPALDIRNIVGNGK